MSAVERREGGTGSQDGDTCNKEAGQAAVNAVERVCSLCKGSCSFQRRLLHPQPSTLIAEPQICRISESGGSLGSLRVVVGSVALLMAKNWKDSHLQL